MWADDPVPLWDGANAAVAEAKVLEEAMVEAAKEDARAAAEAEADRADDEVRRRLALKKAVSQSRGL